MSKKKDNAEAIKAIVMAPEPRWTKPKKIVALAVLVLVLLLAGWIIWSSKQQSDDVTVTPADDKKYQQTRTSTDKLRASQDYDQAKQVWQSYLEDDLSDQEKYKAYMQLAALDETKKDYQAALANYKLAEPLAQDEAWSVYEAIARCAEKLGDNQTAITNYQKALDAFPGGPEYNGDRGFYTKKIETLKAKEAGQNG